MQSYTKYYALWGQGQELITKSWAEVENMRLRYPFIQWRKFYSEGEALKCLRSYAKGDCYPTLYYIANKVKTTKYIEVEYFIDSDRLCYNINTSRVGNISFMNNNRNRYDCETHGDITTLEVKDVYLNPDLILSHIKAIFDLLTFVGPIIDVNIVVPNHSVLYTMLYYQGEDNRILRVLSLIAKRLGATGFTLNKAYFKAEPV